LLIQLGLVEQAVVAIVAQKLAGAVMGGTMAVIGCAIDGFMNNDEKSIGELKAVAIAGAITGFWNPDMGIFSGFCVGLGTSITQRFFDSFDKNHDGKLEFEKRKDGYYIEGKKATKNDIKTMEQIVKKYKTEENKKKKKDS